MRYICKNLIQNKYIQNSIQPKNHRNLNQNFYLFYQFPKPPNIFSIHRQFIDHKFNFPKTSKKNKSKPHISKKLTLLNLNPNPQPPQSIPYPAFLFIFPIFLFSIPPYLHFPLLSIYLPKQNQDPPYHFR